MLEGNPVRILLVNDEQNLLASMKRVFRDEGYEVVALAALGDRDLDVIVSDMRMPEMSVADFLLAASRRLPDTPYRSGKDGVQSGVINEEPEVAGLERISVQ